MNKKIIILALTGALLASCGNQPTPTSSSESSSEQSSQPSSEPSSIPSSSSESTGTSSEETIKVSFNTHGTYDIEQIEYKGEALVLPVPEYYHHEFLGWYENEDYSGSPVDMSAYTPKASITLHAKWDEVVYVYAYYGGKTSNKHNRYSKHAGDVIKFEELGTPEPIVIEGVSCPFLYWGDEMNYQPVSDNHVMDENDYILVAVYDESKIPPKKYLNELPDGSFESTGRVAWPFFDQGSTTGYFTVDVTQVKGSTGGSGVAFRMALDGNDYPFESGQSYLAAVFVFKSGAIQISQVSNNSWKEVKSIALSALPSDYQKQFNETPTGADLTSNMGVISYEDRFEILINGELATTITAADIDAKGTLDPLSSMTGTGFGIRATANGTVFSNMTYEKDAKTIHLNAMEGEPLGDASYFGGKLILPSPRYANHVADKWYYDEERTQEVDLDKPNITDGITLYAGYRVVKHPNLVDNGDGTYKMKGQGAALVGIASSLDFTLKGTFRVKKGSGGASGIILRASMYADNTFQNDSSYFMCQLVASNGSIQIATSDSNRNPVFRHLGGTTAGRALANTPKSWQDAFNNAAVGDYVSAELKVVSTEDSFTLYINGEEFYSPTTQAMLDDLHSVAGLGYGVRINNADNLNQNFTLAYTAGEVNL